MGDMDGRTGSLTASTRASSQGPPAWRGIEEESSVPDSETMSEMSTKLEVC